MPLSKTRTSHVKAVTFDVGGTLIKCFPSVGHIYSEVAAEAGFAGIRAEQINRNFSHAWRNFPDFQHKEEQWARIVEQSFEGLIAKEVVAKFFPAIFQRFAAAEAWQVFEDVWPTLQVFKSAGLKLGIISNWDNRLRPLLDRLGLRSWFETIIISCEVGVGKPDVRIFEAAARELRLSEESILHVGDDREKDLVGAQKADFRAVLLDRRAKRQRRSYQVCSLKELVPMLFGLQQGDRQPLDDSGT